MVIQGWKVCCGASRCQDDCDIKKKDEGVAGDILERPSRALKRLPPSIEKKTSHPTYYDTLGNLPMHFTLRTSAVKINTK